LSIKRNTWSVNRKILIFFRIVNYQNTK